MAIKELQAILQKLGLSAKIRLANSEEIARMRGNVMRVTEDKQFVFVNQDGLQESYKVRDYGLSFLDFCKITLYHEIGHLLDEELKVDPEFGRIWDDDLNVINKELDKLVGTTYQEYDDKLVKNILKAMKQEIRAYHNGRQYVEAELLKAYDGSNVNNLAAKLLIPEELPKRLQLSEKGHSIVVKEIVKFLESYPIERGKIIEYDERQSVAQGEKK
jgi:hypothetical protein